MRKMYKFTKGEDYPPCLEHKHAVPDDVSEDQIFDATRLEPVKVVVKANYDWLTKGLSMLPLIMPTIIKDFKPSKTFHELDINNAELRYKVRFFSRLKILKS